MTDHGCPPRLRVVTLRRGTMVRSLREDGFSALVALDRDVEVGVRRLAVEPGEVSLFVTDSEVILVAFEDEKRGRRKD